MLKFVIMMLIFAVAAATGRMVGSTKMPIKGGVYVSVQYDGPAKITSANSFYGVQIGFRLSQ